MSTTAIKVTDAQIAAEYARTGNIWKVADALGISGQTVSRRMRAGGIPKNRNDWTPEQVEIVRAYYTNTTPEQFDLAGLAKRLGRRKAHVCRVAAELGLTNIGRVKSSHHRQSMCVANAGRWSDKPHPRGFLGGKHDAASREKISEATRRTWATLETFFPEVLEKRKARLNDARKLVQYQPEKMHTRAKGGRRGDLGETFFRSAWEANYARYLNLLMRFGVVEWWKFEPKTFWFEGIKRGVCSYKPDFHVQYKGDAAPIWVEIKGWEVAKDRTKWKRFAKYYPSEKLEIVGAKEFRALARKWASSIPEWE